MPASRGDQVLLENGTVIADRVSMMDLRFWLPQTKAHLCDGAQYAQSNLTLHVNKCYLYDLNLNIFINSKFLLVPV